MASSGDAVTWGDPAQARQAPLALRADLAYYCGAVRGAGARFPVTVKIDPEIAAAIASVG